MKKEHLLELLDSFDTYMMCFVYGDVEDDELIWEWQQLFGEVILSMNDTEQMYYMIIKTVKIPVAHYKGLGCTSNLLPSN